MLQHIKEHYACKLIGSISNIVMEIRTL